MRLKQLPEDFQVTELTDVEPSKGPYALYRLKKRWIGTPEVVQQVLACWRIPRHQLSYGGLKDWHSVSIQHLTIRQGPQRNLQTERFSLEYLGQTAQPFTAKQLVGNHFQVVLRRMSSVAASGVAQRLANLAEVGFPNFFDDQRFGSVGTSGEFVAHRWCQKSYERALWLALADPNRHDTKAAAAEKELLRQHWGDWATCKQSLNRSHRRSIISFLNDRPEDFRGALARIRTDLRSLYLSAFQSHLWNLMLAAWILPRFDQQKLEMLSLRFFQVPRPTQLNAQQRRAWRELTLPLPSCRLKSPSQELQDLLEGALADFDLPWWKMRIPNVRDVFFARANRPAAVFPSQLAHQAEHDELNSGYRKLSLLFSLPPGCYATIFLKWAGAVGNSFESGGDESGGDESGGDVAGGAEAGEAMDSDSDRASTPSGTG